MKKMTLIQLESRTTTQVREILGGEGTKKRLEALGIRPGVELTKVSSHFWKGPVTVRVGKTRVAIGHGMAQKIVVEEKSCS